MFKHLDCNLDRGDFLSVTHKRLQSIGEASKPKNDDFHMQLNDETHPKHTNNAFQNTHTHICRYLKRNNIITDMPESSKRRRPSEMPSFVWKEHCLIYGEECCMTPDLKNPKR